MTIEDYIDTKTGEIKVKTIYRIRKEFEENPEAAGYLAIMILELANMFRERNNAREKKCTT